MTGSDRMDMFASSEVPDITVHQYLERLKALFQCSDAVFVLALINVDRLLERCAVLGLLLFLRSLAELVFGLVSLNGKLLGWVVARRNTLY